MRSGKLWLILTSKVFWGGLIADLILLTTPIGDPKDITMNVLEHLRGGKNFAVEDTRTFKSLLKHFAIDFKEKLIFSFHDQSNSRDLNKAIKILESGENLYFVSEAGSPVIADPAFPLIIESKKLNHQIKSFSGVCSIIKALEVSSIPPCPFSFHGFFPREKSK